MPDEPQGNLPGGPPAAPATPKPKTRFIGKDLVQVEFMIDDLIKRLRVDHVAVASCNGCNHCGSTIESLPQERER